MNTSSGKLFAVLLAGGKGTRIRPLSITRPKPLVPFLNQPMLVFTIKSLVEAGVTDIVICVNYMYDHMKQFAKEYSIVLDVNITVSLESTPLGTAGPLSLLKDVLKDQDDFFMLNGDGLDTFDLKKLYTYHKEKNATATVYTSYEEDPTRFGSVLHDEEGRVTQFVEKSPVILTHEVNSGIYVLNKKVLDMVPYNKKCSIEKDVFPKICEVGEMYSTMAEGFCADLGKIDEMIGLTKQFIDYTNEHPAYKKFQRLYPVSQLREDCMIDCYTVIGKNCSYGEKFTSKQSIIMDNVTIGNNCVIENSVIAPGSKIEDGCHIKNSILADETEVHKGVTIESCKILPFLEIKETKKDSIVLF